MMNKYKIDMPKVLIKLRYGFSVYEKPESIIDEAISMCEMNIKYPDAVFIEQLKHQAGF